MASGTQQTAYLTRLAASQNCVAAFAFLTWDILITMEDEVEHVWNKPFVLTSYLYVFVRYWAWIAQVALMNGVDTIVTSQKQLNMDQCRAWLTWQTVSTEIEMAAVELILILRVHALYGRSRRILCFLLGLAAFEFITMSASLAVSIRGSQSNASCETRLPRAIIAYAVSICLFEALLFFMTLWKVTLGMRHRWRNIHVLRVLLRDGLWAFALVFVVILANALVISLVKNELSAVCLPWLLTSTSFAGYRLLLNLRKIGHEPSTQDLDEDHSAIEFTTFAILTGNSEQGLGEGAL